MAPCLSGRQLHSATLKFCFARFIFNSRKRIYNSVHHPSDLNWMWCGSLGRERSMGLEWKRALWRLTAESQKRISLNFIVRENPFFNIKVCNIWLVTVKWPYEGSKRFSLRNCVCPEVCNIFSWGSPYYHLWHFACIITYTPHLSPWKQDYTNLNRSASLLSLQISDAGIRTEV